MSSSNSSNSSTESGGEVILNSPPTKQISPAKRWCFTYHLKENNPLSSIVPENAMSYDFIKIIDENCKVAIIGKELGERGETPHLQGYIEFHTKKRPFSLGLDKTIRWEKARGNKQSNFDYCKKEGFLVFSKGVPLAIKLISPDFDWEQEILTIIGQEPDDRTIYWYWGVGNLGKTSFCKYLTVKHGAIALGGKGADMRNGVVEYSKTNGSTPELVLINVPRSFDCEYISYEGIENVKDMYFYSGKYEGGMVCGANPHVFVFANEPPNINKLSGDRWVIKEISPVDIPDI